MPFSENIVDEKINQNQNGIEMLVLIFLCLSAITYSNFVEVYMRGRSISNNIIKIERDKAKQKNKGEEKSPAKSMAQCLTSFDLIRR